MAAYIARASSREDAQVFAIAVLQFDCWSIGTRDGESSFPGVSKL